MIPGIIGKKITQTQVFTADGMRIPVTSVAVEPCIVVQTKTMESDHYTAVQLGFGTKKLKHTTKPIQGHIKKTGIGEKPPRFLSEIRLTTDVLPEGLAVGSTIHAADIFEPGDMVHVRGISKGKGFAGAVKRHGFSGGPRTHGQSDRERAPGSIGSGTTPGRIYKGKRMAGHMGDIHVTIQNLEIVSVDREKNILMLKGLVPGARGSMITIIKK